MSRWWLIAIAVVILIPVLAVERASGPDRGRANRLWESFNAEVRRAKRTDGIVVIANATEFPWTRMLLFGAYTPAREIERRLGFHWAQAGAVAPESQDCEQLVVFATRDRVQG